ncbi:LytR/AlgR family response regulator transcription factor [Oceanobacillus alkalisoli]|uniref:LytR/AlgR family response regulator transcription factor n=1 Tax=Oceanobacillus alkalisoli TaxID=2925113 RepID=UPI001EE4432E|nr:LytTR family DNA-binding domain-containing protein [Oceanobacillus alkalisoli]MCG5104937.1 LytTR family DNA-binding domain-containing protein [Oceanobacillus alkalisoli]
MIIRAMIAEDEAMARKELMYLLQHEDDIIMSPHAETGEELIEQYQLHQPDVIFLDVEMPGMSGVEAAKYITKDEVKQPLFIFTTAYDEYAMDAFDIEAIDYLLKPYEESHFKRALKRLRKALHSKELDKSASEPQVMTDKLLIDDGERMVVLSPESIYYAVPHKKQIEIHTLDKVIKSKLTLRELETKLNDESFFRTHRSYLVNLNHILEITPWFNGTSNVTLKDRKQTKIPVSRSASKILIKKFKI